MCFSHTRVFCRTHHHRMENLLHSRTKRSIYKYRSQLHGSKSFPLFWFDFLKVCVVWSTDKRNFSSLLVAAIPNAHACEHCVGLCGTQGDVSERDLPAHQAHPCLPAPSWGTLQQISQFRPSFPPESWARFISRDRRTEKDYPEKEQ